MPPVIKKESCIGCGACVFVCGKYVFNFPAGRLTPQAVNADDCVDCFMCEDACSSKAVTIKVKFK